MNVKVEVEFAGLQMTIENAMYLEDLLQQGKDWKSVYEEAKAINFSYLEKKYGADSNPS